MYKPTAIIISSLYLLQGCANSPTEQQKLPNVTSNPSRAIVYANGLEIGKTPLKRNLFDDFPAGWQNSVYTAQGVLIMKKVGCKDYTLKINDRILSEPIHAELECDNVSAFEKLTPAVRAQNKIKNIDENKAKSKTEGTTQKRLKELEGLFKKGIITKDEYQTTRARILNEL